jgi:hypothetical protein
MRTTELFRTCANEHVAAAALACIGGKLHKRATAASQRAGLSVGVFVAGLVVDYDRKASPRRRKILEMGMGRSETPILDGLAHVVDTALAGAWDVSLEMARGAEARMAERRRLRWEGGARSPLRPELELKSICN